MSRFAYLAAMALSLVIAAPVLAQSAFSAPDGGIGIAAAASPDSVDMSTSASQAATNTSPTQPAAHSTP